jgi:hypothetical protein
MKPSERMGQPMSDTFVYVTVNDNLYKYIKNPGYTAYFSVKEYRDFYKGVWYDGDTVIIPVNTTLKNNKYVDPPLVDNAKAMMAKGDLGCIPNFSANVSGDVLFKADPNDANMVFVPLAIAIHDPMPPNGIITPLKVELFRMTRTNYDLLNGEYREDPTIEGGLDSIANNVKRRFTVYKGENQLLSMVEE